MPQVRSPWLAALLFFTVAPVASAEDASSSSLLSRLFHRDHQTAAVHQHVPARQAVAPAYQYDYTLAQVQPAAPTYEYAYAQPTEAGRQAGGDPYGFARVLNRIRAAAGLRPLAYDPSLSSWARRNNVMQSIRGIGHYVNPGAAQNSAYNYGDAESVAAGWMNSPGHRENMLSPTATSFGVAFGPGPYWTMNTR